MKTLVRALIIGFILTMMYNGYAGYIAAKAHYIGHMDNATQRIK